MPSDGQGSTAQDGAPTLAVCPKCGAVHPAWKTLYCHTCHGGGARNHPETLVPLFPLVCMECRRPLTYYGADPTKLECVPCMRIIAPDAAARQALSPKNQGAPWKCPGCGLEAPPNATGRTIQLHKCFADLLNRKAQEKLARAIERQTDAEARAPVGPTQSPPRLAKRAHALALLARHPDWTDMRIAAEVGVNRTTLYRWREYRKAREQAKAAKREQIRHRPTPPQGKNTVGM